MIQQRTILVIDDDQDILDLAKLALEPLGLRVITASAGAEGLAAVKAHSPDLVLCDMIMETDGAGLNVCRTMRESGCTIPVVLVSNVGDASEQVFDVYAEGFSAVIQKPFRPEKLAELVSSVLARK